MRSHVLTKITGGDLRTSLHIATIFLFNICESYSAEEQLDEQAAASTPPRGRINPIAIRNMDQQPGDTFLLLNLFAMLHNEVSLLNLRLFVTKFEGRKEHKRH